MTLAGRFLSSLIQKGTLQLTHANGEVESFGESHPDFPNVAVKIHGSSTMRQIVTDPRLGAGEAFMDGRIEIEKGDIMEFLHLVRGNKQWDLGGTLHEPGALSRLKTRLMAGLDSVNGLARSKSNVAHHYDIGNDLYRLFLDEDMQYSCAYWDFDRFGKDMTLEQAQEAKKAHIAAKLDLKPGQRVLDIGCGWGGMAFYIHRKTGAEVLGITLSEEQLALAQERAEKAGVADKVKFELIDYRDLAKREAAGFDRIVSVGMFEHVGVPNFETFFRSCANLLTDDGVMLIHTIGRTSGPGKTDAFTRKYIFPGGYIPALSETLRASEKYRLIHTDIETLRLHYAFTLREWYKRTAEHKDEIVAMYDERFYRMWTFYLAGATAAFESGGMCNYQIQYCRNRHVLPLTRNYLGEAEEKLLS